MFGQQSNLFKSLNKLAKLNVSASKVLLEQQVSFFNETLKDTMNHAGNLSKTDNLKDILATQKEFASQFATKANDNIKLSAKVITDNQKQIVSILKNDIKTTSDEPESSSTEVSKQVKAATTTNTQVTAQKAAPVKKKPVAKKPAVKKAAAKTVKAKSTGSAAPVKKAVAKGPAKKAAPVKSKPIVKQDVEKKVETKAPEKKVIAKPKAASKEAKKPTPVVNKSVAKPVSVTTKPTPAASIKPEKAKVESTKTAEVGKNTGKKVH
jgi:hypothetical protein